MPRYYFDIHDGTLDRDETGIDCSDFEVARKQAMASLPEIGFHEIPKDGDRQAFTVLVRDENDRIVYTATLTFAGLRLHDDQTVTIAGDPSAQP